MVGVASHDALDTVNLHVPGYLDSSDPGAIGAGRYWIDTSGGTGSWVLKVRNETDDGWEEIASGGGGGIPDTIFDAKGDLITATAADTPARLAAGSNDQILMADSGQSAGLKWVGSQTPSTQAFGDAAAEGTADTYARGDHKHAMPADPVTAHVAAGDPHSQYQRESERGNANGYAALDSGGLVPVAQLGTGTPTGAKFLRDDQTYAVPSGSGMSNPMTTQDDIIVGGSGGTPDRLAKGTDGQVLTVDPSTHHLIWATPRAANPMTTAGDLILGGSSGVEQRLAKGSDSQVLTIDPSTHLPVWATASGGYTDPLTTRGDIVKRGASATERLGIGSAGEVLTVTDVGSGNLEPRWAAAGGTPAIVKLGSVTVSGSSQATISFTSISGSYSHLQLRIRGRSSAAVTQADIVLRFNSDSGANYDQELIIGNGTSVSGAQVASGTSINLGAVAGASSPSNHLGALYAEIIGYADTNFFKAAIANNWFTKTTGAGNLYNLRYNGHWRSTSAITRIDLTLTSGNWDIGTVVDLYGVS